MSLETLWVRLKKYVPLEFVYLPCKRLWSRIGRPICHKLRCHGLCKSSLPIFKIGPDNPPLVQEIEELIGLEKSTGFPEGVKYPWRTQLVRVKLCKICFLICKRWPIWLLYYRLAVRGPSSFNLAMIYRRWIRVLCRSFCDNGGYGNKH